MKFTLFLWFKKYSFFELPIQNSSGVLTDRVWTKQLLSKWDFGTNFKNLCKLPKTFSSRILGESYIGEHSLSLHSHPESALLPRDWTRFAKQIVRPLTQHVA